MSTVSIPSPVGGQTDTAAENKQSGEDETPADHSLWIEIADATIDQEKVVFTVHTKTTLPEWKPELLVSRHHEEFLWLHDRLQENDQHAGYIIPPTPPRPDFNASREKLQRLTKQQTLTEEEFVKMKKEVEAEYLATFKKTVAMHEVFLRRLATHPAFRADPHFRTFVELPRDLSAKPSGLHALTWLVQKTGQSIFKNLVRGSNESNTIDSNLLTSGTTVTDTTAIHDEASEKDFNEFFEQQAAFLSRYHTHLNTAAMRVDRVTTKHKDVAEALIKLSSCVAQLAALEQPPTQRCLASAAECFDKCRKVEGRIASDLDLKLADTLRYYMRDAHSAQAAIDRRQSCQAAYEAAYKNLEQARATNKNVGGARSRGGGGAGALRAAVCARGCHARRVAAFRDSLVALAELEIKHAHRQQELFRESIQVLKEKDCH